MIAKLVIEEKLNLSQLNINSIMIKHHNKIRLRLKVYNVPT